MEIGTRIREMRLKCNLTQKDLADKLNVTSQAVSRWENDNVEPSLDTLQKMTSIFNTNIDELMGNKAPSEPVIKPVNVQSETIQAETIALNNYKRTIGICENCHKAIVEGEEIFTYSTGGRNRQDFYLCKDCEEKRQTTIKQNILNSAVKGRKRGFIWGGIIASINLLLFIVASTAETTGLNVFLMLLGGTVVSYMLFSLIFCIFVKNNFIGDMWLEVASWGFVHMPGVIFSLDFDGLVLLILVKIFFFLITMLLVLSAFALSTILAGSLSIFVFPYALKKSLKHPELTTIL
jgi:transcriptional regulator with XRE-family HTH domain